MLEKFVRPREVEVWVAKFLEGVKGAKKCETLILKGYRRIDIGCGVEVRYVKIGTEGPSTTAYRVDK